MSLVGFQIEIFCGFGFEVEYAKGDWYDFDYDYLLVDLLCFRLMFTFGKE